MKRKNLIKKLSNKKNLNSENIMKLYDSLSPSERSYVKDIFEDDILEKDEFDYNDVVVDDLNRIVAERLYKELHGEYGEAEIESPSLYDQDKLDLLKKAFDIYNLDQLIEKLGITQMEAM